MKTKEQIIQWYKDNGYYEDFAKEIKRARGISVGEFLSRGRDPQPSRAFIWDGSIKGVNYWEKVQVRFTRWFNNDKIPQQFTTTKEIDWEQRRYEIARSVLAASSPTIHQQFLMHVDSMKNENDVNCLLKQLNTGAVETSVTLADALINELKKNKEEL